MGANPKIQDGRFSATYFHLIPLHPITSMNKLLSQLQPSSNAFEQENLFGNIEADKGVRFNVPAVHDVSPPLSPSPIRSKLTPSLSLFAALRLSPASHRRPLRSLMQDQTQPRNHHPGLQVQRRHHRRGRQSSNRWKLHRYLPFPFPFSLSLFLFLLIRWVLTDFFLGVASGTVKKVIEINKYLLGTMAGGAGPSPPCPFLSTLKADHPFFGMDSRLPVLGNIPRHAVPPTRTSREGKDLGRCCFQVSLQLGLLLQGDGAQYGNDDLRLGQDRSFYSFFLSFVCWC